MLTLRTLDERFTGLHDLLRIAYVAAGPPGGQVRFARVTRPDDPATEANRAAWAALRRSEIPFLAGHFLQEDAGPELARVVVEFAAHRG